MATLADANQRKLGFIYETVESSSEAMEGVPKSRTLLAADLTDQPATQPVFNYECETMDDVFDHYQPIFLKESSSFTEPPSASVNSIFTEG